MCCRRIQWPTWLRQVSRSIVPACLHSNRAQYNRPPFRIQDKWTRSESECIALPFIRIGAAKSPWKAVHSSRRICLSYYLGHRYFDISSTKLVHNELMYSTNVYLHISSLQIGAHVWTSDYHQATVTAASAASEYRDLVNHASTC